MGRHHHHAHYIPFTPIPSVPLIIPDDFITSAMIKHQAILGIHVGNEVIEKIHLNSFLIEWLRYDLQPSPCPITSEMIKPGEIHKEHLSTAPPAVDSDQIADGAIQVRHLSTQFQPQIHPIFITSVIEKTITNCITGVAYSAEFLFTEIPASAIALLVHIEVYPTFMAVGQNFGRLVVSRKTGESYNVLMSQLSFGFPFQEDTPFGNSAFGIIEPEKLTDKHKIRFSIVDFATGNKATVVFKCFGYLS